MNFRGGLGKRVPPQRRFAFLLGNADYAHVGSLINPLNDIGNVARQLRGLGYQVSDFRNLDWRNTWFQLQEFVHRADACDAMVLYYCGHGVQLDGDNYIVPVDFDPNVPVDHDAQAGALAGLVRVQDLMLAMGTAKARLIFLDACRNEGGLQQVRVRYEPATAAAPDLRSGRGSDATVTRSLNAGQGLARPRLGEHRQMFVCFAADPGDVAEDGPAGGMSPFSEAVASHIGIRGLDVFDFSQRIARDVRQRTEGRQTPWTNSNLTDDFAFHPADNQPVWILGALGALTGLIGAVLNFNLFPLDSSWMPHLAEPKLQNVREHPIFLLSPLLLGSVLGYGAYRWGRRAWHVPVLTCLFYTAVAGLSRFWLAPYSSDAEILKKLHELKPSNFLSGGQFSLVRELLLIAILSAALAGAATVFSAAPFVRDMSKMPRISMGAIAGAAGAALFLLFVWARSNVSEWLNLHYSTDVQAGYYFWLEPFWIIVLMMVWEAALAINVGRAYAKPTNE